VRLSRDACEFRTRGRLSRAGMSDYARGEEGRVSFDDEVRSLTHYRKRARWYDWANRLAALLRGTSGVRERMKAIARLRLASGDRVLEVCSGTGTNLSLMEQSCPGGELVGLDLTREMLLRSRERGAGRARLVEGEASRLPFRDGAFDALLHHGGLAEFGDRRRALDEMRRVARAGGRIVICDVGVPADRKLPLTSRLLLRTQPEYDKPPPTDLLPTDLADLQLNRIGGGAWYLIDFTNPAGADPASEPTDVETAEYV
jgi:ubiquinone/menaquinone biosynthesis C-methylase UbiE